MRVFCCRCDLTKDQSVSSLRDASTTWRTHTCTVSCVHIHAHERADAQRVHLEDTRWGHCPPLSRGVEPTRAREAAPAGAPGSCAAGLLRRPHATPRAPVCSLWGANRGDRGSTVCHLAQASGAAPSQAQAAHGGPSGEPAVGIVGTVGTAGPPCVTWVVALLPQLRPLSYGPLATAP